MTAPTDSALKLATQIRERVYSWQGEVGAGTQDRIIAETLDVFAAIVVTRERERCRRIAFDHALGHAAAFQKMLAPGVRPRDISPIFEAAQDACNEVAWAIESTEV